MAPYQKRKVKWPWRDYLTTAEASEMRELESEALEIDNLRLGLTVKMNRIRNRGIQRAGVASKKASR